MTTVEILFRYTAQPSETVARAVAGTREVYGIRKLSFDRPAQTLRIEYDATRLNAAVVTRLMLQAGLEITEELALISAPPVAETAPAT
jgi:hypothetical protein